MSDHTPQETELLDCLADMTAQACHVDAEGRLDSCATSATADALRLLARFGRVRIVEERSPRWIVAEWVREGVGA